MRYFVTILTLYINSSRAYVIYAYARKKCTCYGRASRTPKKVGKGGIEEMEEEKEKRNAHREIYC